MWLSSFGAEDVTREIEYSHVWARLALESVTGDR